MQIGANSGKCMQTYMTIAHMLFVQNTTIAHVICAKIAIINNYNSCNRLTETFISKRTLWNSMLVHNSLLLKGELLVNMLGIFTVGKNFPSDSCVIKTICSQEAFSGI